MANATPGTNPARGIYPCTFTLHFGLGTADKVEFINIHGIAAKYKSCMT